MNRLIQHSNSHSIQDDRGNDIAAALLIADSTNTLTVCNNIIIAMVSLLAITVVVNGNIFDLQASCHDGPSCSNAMAGLRIILRQFEPHSLMCLLLRLIDQCPFVFISGKLVI